MTAGRLIRQVHRWTSLLFAVVVAALFTALGVGAVPPQWSYFVPLAPLAVLLLSGVWLFVQPYLGRGAVTSPPAASG